MRIQSEAEYKYCLKRGHEPLTSWALELDHDLRVDIQNNKFKSINTFYKYMWDKKPHLCENCGQYLREYSAVYISHILSRGAHPKIALDPRNINILCYECHHKWEFGDKSYMRIYELNIDKIQQLKSEYYVQQNNFGW